MRAICGAIVAIVAGGCGPVATSGPRATTWAHEALRGLPAQTDRPYDLSDDGDLSYVRQGLDVLPLVAPERIERRSELADEYARRIDRGFATGRRAEAYQAFVSLVGMWSQDMDTASAGLAPYAAQVAQVRTSYARSGSDAEVVLALVVQRAVSPQHMGEIDRELELIFSFSDDLAVARFGAGARRGHSIQLLEQAVETFPAPFAVDRLVALYTERQQAISVLFEGAGGPDISLISAHGPGLFQTTWNIVRALARVGGLERAAVTLEPVRGVGDDLKLRAALAEAMASGASPIEWVKLAGFFVDDDDTKTDLDAALAVIREATERFPDDARLYAVAGAICRQAGHLPLALHYTERSVQLDPSDRDVTEVLASLYERRVNLLALTDRPQEARLRLAELEAFHTAAAKRFVSEPLASDLAEAYATMGRGLLSQGQVSGAVEYLRKSLDLRANYQALELLSTVEQKQRRFSSAAGYLERALVLPAATANDYITRAKLRRMLGDAYRGAGRHAEARRQWERAVEVWQQVANRYQLTESATAEMLVEVGKIYWAMGNPEVGLEQFQAAVDLGQANEAIYADVLSFLAVRADRETVADFYHRALGATGPTGYFKVYMSMWLLISDRLAGVQDDPLAVDYLRSRSGDQWHDQLAQMAVGALTYEQLMPRADTRGRRAELYYYRAMLELVVAEPARAKHLLEFVQATDMLTFFEYDMAAYLLQNGFVAPAPMAAPTP